VFSDAVMVQAAAARYGVPPILVTALIEQESAGNAWAWNPEPRYRYLWDVRQRRPFRPVSREEIASEIPPADFPRLAGDRDQEWWGQQASWGLMQVMGAVAREHGFDAPYLPALCDPWANLDIGCRHLLYLKGRFHEHHGWAGVVAAYNAGSPRRATAGSIEYENQVYVDQVMRRLGGVTL